MVRKRNDLRAVTFSGDIVGLPEATSDAELVTRIRSGDRWAEEALYRRYVKGLTRLVLHLLGSLEEAEDIVQDTFVIALPAIARLRNVNAVGAWLSRIAVNRAHRCLRRRKLVNLLGLRRNAEEAAFSALASESLSPDVRADLSALDRVLNTLSAKERIAWVLHRVEAETLEAVATLCDCSLATAKRRIAVGDVRVHKGLGLDQDAKGQK